MKKYFITTYGCQANIRDSENISGMLEALGMLEVRSLGEADLVVVNTCSVRQASEDKVYGLANKIKKLKVEDGKLKVILTGCLVGSATSARPRLGLNLLKKKMPWVDYYLNINQLTSLPSYLFDCNFVDEWAFKAVAGGWLPKDQNHDGTAYVNISQGCDNFCTFCVVPYARGKEVSRSEKDILEEVKHAVHQGFNQVMLLGQNVNSWGLDTAKKLLSRKRIGEIPFSKLLSKVHEIEGIEKIKFITSNPFDFTSDLVDALKLPKIDRYLHLPVQSGDNEILEYRETSFNRVTSSSLNVLSSVSFSLTKVSASTPKANLPSIKILKNLFLTGWLLSIRSKLPTINPALRDFWGVIWVICGIYLTVDPNGLTTRISVMGK